MRPIIGITLDWEEKGTFSKRPYYALRTSYFDIIYAAGGLPVAIPYLGSSIGEYLDKISALVVPGGDFALKNEWYINPNEDKPHPHSLRLDFDIEITKQALARNIPFLGICAGMQVMGGVLGAKMTPNANKHHNTKIDHRNQKPAEEFAHDVIVASGSLLHKITGMEQFAVNTAHSEALVATPPGVIVNAKSEDGVIEAIEAKNNSFALGVQWHPEFFITEKDPSFMIFKALVSKAKGNK